ARVYGLEAVYDRRFLGIAPNGGHRPPLNRKTAYHIEPRMKFSIIIPTYNRADELRETLGSLARLNPASDWEVIVADNNSRDPTKAVVDQASNTFPVALRYLFEPEQGRCAALNAGIRAARGQII